jgi:hypothetical protein
MFSANDFIPKSYSHIQEQGSFTWSAPSNIALVKYWGKKGQPNSSESVDKFYFEPL